MLIIQILQAVFVVALLLAAGTRPTSRLLLWAAVGFAASQILTSGNVSPADTFFRLFIAVSAVAALDSWKAEREWPIWTAGPAALLSGFLVGWVA
ncbi:hypothetical protein AB0N14_04490 [Streptomyces sp. NPDC051104]|uniref:hypothetical protein n=1 Tax=Streptomyces sp. NPDC051104 TaxID=3155044 RepID=UPI0034421B20